MMYEKVWRYGTVCDKEEKLCIVTREWKIRDRMCVNGRFYVVFVVVTPKCLRNCTRMNEDEVKD